MTIIFEFNKPFQWKPGRYRSRIMTRYYFGFVAVAFLHISLLEFSRQSFQWEDR